MVYQQPKQSEGLSMYRRQFLCCLAALASVPQVAISRELKPYGGPQITRVVLHKSRRRLYLLSGETVVKDYKVGLGSAPAGPKRFEGDGKTPEGSYIIDRRNPNSSFHLSIGISYPNTQDQEFAAAHGKRAGGDIFIHGRARQNKGKGRDWTAGCIAVKDRHIEQIYMMVQLGTQIDIYP